MSLLTVGFLPAPAWSGYMLHQASPALYWGTIPGEKEMLKLKEMGVKTLINVRTNPLKGHERMANKLGLRFVHIKTGVVLPPQEREIGKFLSFVSNPEDRPIYIFCTLGTDRTCYYVAAYRIAIDGWTVEQAARELDAHGLKHWWPTFREYDDALKANENLLHRLGKAWLGPRVARTPPDMVDPCVDIVGSKKKRSKPGLLARARRLTLTVLTSPLEGLYKGSVALKLKLKGQPESVTNAVVDSTFNGE